jgi:hypothetical protein
MVVVVVMMVVVVVGALTFMRVLPVAVSMGERGAVYSNRLLVRRASGGHLDADVGRRGNEGEMFTAGRRASLGPFHAYRGACERVGVFGEGVDKSV